MFAVRGVLATVLQTSLLRWWSRGLSLQYHKWLLEKKWKPESEWWCWGGWCSHRPLKFDYYCFLFDPLVFFIPTWNGITDHLISASLDFWGQQYSARTWQSASFIHLMRWVFSHLLSTYFDFFFSFHKIVHNIALFLHLVVTTCFYFKNRMSLASSSNEVKCRTQFAKVDVQIE